MANDAIEYSVLNNILWNRWQEMLPNSPGYMALKILADLDKQGWKIVRKDELDTSIHNEASSTKD